MSPRRARNALIAVLIAFLGVAGFGPDAALRVLAEKLAAAPNRNIVDKTYLAQHDPNVVDRFKTGVKEAEAALDPDELEYGVDVGPVNGSTSANYVYAALFNASGSGRTALVKRLAVRANAVSTANYVNLTVRRITASSAGSQIAAADLPRKNADSSDPVLAVRYAGPSVTFAGTADSRILGQAMPGAAGQFHSVRDIAFGADDEPIVLQPGEGIAVYQEAAGDADQRVRVYAEWEEVASAPSAQTEFLFAFPRVENAASANYVYNSFFNPSGSGKTAIVKRVWFGSETCDTTAVYTNNLVLRRTSAASGGTAITASNVPKKHTGSADSVMGFRRTGVTVTAVGGADARLAQVTPCGAAGQPHGWMELNLHANDEKIILQQGEGIALMADAGGDVDQLNRMIVEWQEVASGSTPASQGEYMLAFSRISNEAVAPAVNTTFYTFFNPSGSGRTAVVKRLVIRNNADAAATYSAFNFRRVTAASGGSQIAAADIPKKHTGSGNSVIEARSCGATCGSAISATYAGTADSDLLVVNGPGAAGQVVGQREIVFGGNEGLVLQQGEGVGFYLDATTGDIDHYVKIAIEWDEEASAPSSAGEYLIDIGPVSGSTATSYTYASFFNPSGSGTTAIVKRLGIVVNAVSTATYVPMQVRRVTAASGGTQIAAANIPKKHTGTANSAMEIRRTGVSATYAGSADSRLAGVQTPGAAGSAVAPATTGHLELAFGNDEYVVLQPGEGIALYHDSAAGDADFRVKLLVEWEEVASGSTPASEGEYLMTVGPVNGSLNADYVYATLFNPAASGKNYVVKRIGIRADRNGTLVSLGYLPVTLRRITAASAGTQVAVADVPKKHGGTANATAEVRHTGVTAAMAGAAASRLFGVAIPGAVNQSIGDYESELVPGDELILAPGEGIALYQEAAVGDALVRFRANFEWSESDAGGGGTLTVDIVDAGGASVASPTMGMGSVALSFPYQTANGTFGVSSQKIRVDNGTGNAQWTLTLAANAGPTALWSAGAPKYDFNDPTASAGDGGDADAYGGRMTVDASGGTLAPQGGCATTGLTLGSAAGYSEGATDSITLLTAGASAETGCFWDVTGVAISQTVPAEQSAGSYAVEMTLTVTAN